MRLSRRFGSGLRMLSPSGGRSIEVSLFYDGRGKSLTPRSRHTGRCDDPMPRECWRGQNVGQDAMTELLVLLAAATTFVGTHFLMSHPLRRALLGAVGEKGFLALYSLVAFATFGVTIWAYQSAPVTEFWWQVGDGLWATVTVSMLFASILFVGSFSKNPALPGSSAEAGTAASRGVYAVTRHPMMWAIAIWGASHILIYPVAKNIIFSSAMIILALVGATMQDRKRKVLDPQGWPTWEAKTSHLPFAAIATGRAKFGGLGMHAVGGGLILWLLATWAHVPLAGWPAGVWRWLI